MTFLTSFFEFNSCSLTNRSREHEAIYSDDRCASIPLTEPAKPLYLHTMCTEINRNLIKNGSSTEILQKERKIVSKYFSSSVLLWMFYLLLWLKSLLATLLLPPMPFTNKDLQVKDTGSYFCFENQIIPYHHEYYQQLLAFHFDIKTLPLSALLPTSFLSPVSAGCEGHKVLSRIWNLNTSLKTTRM